MEHDATLSNRFNAKGQRWLNSDLSRGIAYGLFKYFDEAYNMLFGEAIKSDLIVVVDRVVVDLHVVAALRRDDTCR